MGDLNIRVVLEKMANSDSDYRYMATSDLLTHLRTDVVTLKADHDMQLLLCQAVLKLLKDSNSEVQGMATKCLPPLSSFVNLQNSVSVANELIEHVLLSHSHQQKSCSHASCEKAVRDVATLALKNILQELSSTSAKAQPISSSILHYLVPYVRQAEYSKEQEEILIDTLEILNIILSRFGSVLRSSHAPICEAVFQHFSSKNALIRKRTISCLAALSAVCDNSIFFGIVERALQSLRTRNSPDSLRTGVQTISFLSKTSGHRLAPHLQTLVPILLELTARNDNENDDDLREHCLQALASFSLRCRREMLHFAQQLSSIVVRVATYDPNYLTDDDDGGDDDDDDNDPKDSADNMVDDEDDDYGDEYDDEDYSDDDDSSWKVRRAAVRCIGAIISAQLRPVKELCSDFGPFLVSRFKEREEMVKLDVFSSFGDLLWLCGHRSIQNNTSVMGSPDDMAVDDTDKFDDQVESLISKRNRIIRSLNKELLSPSTKTKVKAMETAAIVVATLPMLITPLVSKIVDAVKKGLADPATGMRTETLQFLRKVIKFGGASPLVDHIQTLMPQVLATMDDRYYKVTVECLHFCSAAVVTFGSCPSAIRSKVSPLASGIYEAAIRRATAQDQDSEVKEVALHCVGGTVACFSSDLTPSQVQDVSRVLGDRLGNDVTRIASLRALYLIGTSESSHVLTPAFPDIVPLVSSFLRKSDSTLRTASIELLAVIPVLPPSSHEDLIANISELISVSDLRVASLALQLSTKIVKERGASVVNLISQNGSIYSHALALSTSSLLQGRAVGSLLDLFSSLAYVNAPPITIQHMLQSLEGQASGVSFNISTSSARGSPLFCIAKCIVSVCRAAETYLRIQTTEQIIGNINSDDFKARIFALACLAEFGRGSLLPKEGNEKENVRNAVFTALQAPVEEVKTAAAVALGGLASADGASDLPALVSLIREKGDQRYLLLLSLKEAIISVSAASLKGLVPVILPLLLDEAAYSQAVDTSDQTAMDGGRSQARSSEEESIHTATAECLGFIIQTCPEASVDALVHASCSESSDVRAAVASAIKYAISSSLSVGSSPQPQLRASLSTFLELVGDRDVVVAKNAIQAVNAVAKSFPGLLLPHLSSVLPLIYGRTAKDKDLIRIVDLGPFKHEEDYGLDLRKSAFDCLRTLISGPLASSIQLVGLLEHAVVGLNDQSDVRSIAQLILVASAEAESARQMFNVMEPIVMALEATLNEKLKDNAVRQEVERYEESIRGALRAVHAMEGIPDIVGNHAFQSFLNRVVRTPRLNERYTSISKSAASLLSPISDEASKANSGGVDSMRD